MPALTQILDASRAGDPEACAQLSALLYEELLRLARREMAAERGNHTLQPTALVHEAYLRLTADGGADLAPRFENRAHFLGAAAIAIRRILVEHARARARLKRGGGQVSLDLAEVEAFLPVPDESVLELDDALERLAEFAPRHARIVELRFFAGLTMLEIAGLLEVSESTVHREWRLARAWLRGELMVEPGQN